MSKQDGPDMNPLYKQMLDDEFDAFTMLSEGSIVTMMHVQGNTTRWSPAGVELFGLSGEYIPNGSMDWGDYVHPEDRKRYLNVMVPLATGKRQNYDLTYRVRTKNGDYQNFRAVGSVIRDANGAPSLIGGLLINQGVADSTDAVTVLPNKLAFRKTLIEYMAARKDTIALQVGISRMSEINQVHGYTYGNRILQETSWLIQEIIKERAKVFRTDGATFVILSDALTREEMAAIYDMIRYRMQRGIQINGIKNILAANGGLISTHGTQSNAETVYSCLCYAYEESKQHKHGELVDFNGSINYSSSKSIEMLSTMRACILENCTGFSMRYSPVIELKTEHRTGAEAKIIWNHELYGTVTEADFMPILERDFIFEELGDFILRQALTDGAELNKKQPGFLLCINIYRIQLESDYFTENLFKILEETGFPANQLSLKFTSDCRYVGIERVRSVIETLHQKEILAIIDGFGSGTDSILFLKDAPVDAVCIDPKFTGGIEKSGRDQEILEYLTKMAATCVKHINICGIDTAELHNAVKKIPATTAQGTYFSALLTKDELATI